GELGDLAEGDAAHRRADREVARVVDLELVECGRVGPYSDLVRGRYEPHDAEPAVATVRVTLEVGQQRVDGVSGEGVLPAPLARHRHVREPADVAGEHEEE